MSAPEEKHAPRPEELKSRIDGLYSHLVMLARNAAHYAYTAYPELRGEEEAATDRAKRLGIEWTGLGSWSAVQMCEPWLRRIGE